MSLAVICAHFNPSGYHAPRRNLMRFLRQLTVHKIPVFVAELAYDDEPFFLPCEPNIFHFRTSRSNIFWHKENLLNLAAERLPPDEYDMLAWIDPDVHFLRANWIDETRRVLEKAAVAQLFSEILWTNLDGKYYRHRRGAAADGRLQLGHNYPGFAWAARRGLWTEAGGLCELGVLGGGDAIFAAAALNSDLPAWLHYPQWPQWTNSSGDWVRNHGGCGVVQGALVHEWHGSLDDRKYSQRHTIADGMDISKSFVRRKDGLLQFAAHVSSDCRIAFAEYFSGRNEDA